MFEKKKVTIVFILVTAVVVVGFIGLQQYTKFKQENYLKPAMARHDIIKIMTVLLIYQQQEGVLPDSQSYENLPSYTPLSDAVRGPIPVNDPWGKPYIYRFPGREGLPYSVISYGADGQTGGAGKNRDISSDPVHLKYKDKLDINRELAQ